MDIILNTVQSGIILVGQRDQVIRYANPVALEMLGWEEQEVIGRVCHNFVCPSNCGSCPVLDLGKTVDKSERKLLRKSGEELDILKSIAKVNIGDESYLLECFLDITDQKSAEKQRKLLEAQLIQSQKLEAVGRLAGGIAHDFNNILTSTMGYAELLAMRFNDETTSDGRAANIIFRNSKRAAHLTKQLLGYARKGKFNPVSLKINKLIHEILSVSDRIFEKRIKVHLDLDDVPNVLGDQNQIDQVLTNILINARDAITETGDIFISTESATVYEEGRLNEVMLKPGEYVKISIRDNGTGMSDSTKKHIFDPFFTTKGEGKGSGLGLATVYGIINNHNGNVEVESTLDTGTVFHLYLPVTRDRALDPAENEKGVVKGNATVLVVDDEEDIRGLSEELLGLLGYKVILAENGIQGVQIYQDMKDEIQLVLLDMVMPKMNGEEALQRIISFDSEAKIVLMSGYSEKGLAEIVENKYVSGFIQKPFGLQDVSSVLETVLSP